MPSFVVLWIWTSFVWIQVIFVQIRIWLRLRILILKNLFLANTKFFLPSQTFYSEYVIQIIMFYIQFLFLIQNFWLYLKNVNFFKNKQFNLFYFLYYYIFWLDLDPNPDQADLIRSRSATLLLAAYYSMHILVGRCIRMGCNVHLIFTKVFRYQNIKC